MVEIDLNTLQLAINAFKELLHSPDNKAARAKARIELETFIRVPI